MGIIGTILCVIGVVALVWGGMQKFKAGRLAGAPLAKTGDIARKGKAVAGDKGAISAEGAVRCAEPLTSPVTGTPCLYYELKVVGTWKEGDDKKSRDYVDEKAAAAFALDDGSGPVPIHAEEGGDFESLETTFEETKKEGFFADLKSAVGKGEPMKFGKYGFRNPTNSRADTFQCTEKVLKVPAKLYACGKTDDRGGIGAPSWTSLILSTRSRDELLGSTQKAARNFLMGGAGSLSIGVVVGLLSLVIGGGGANADAEAAVPDAAQTTCAEYATHIQSLMDAEAEALGDQEYGTVAEQKEFAAMLAGALQGGCEQDDQLAEFPDGVACVMDATSTEMMDGCTTGDFEAWMDSLLED